MERLAQTKKRNGRDEPRKLHKSNDTLDYLRETAEREFQIRQGARGEEEARGRYHGYSEDTTYSASRSTVSNAATTVYADMMHMMLNSQQAQSQAVIELLQRG